MKIMVLTTQFGHTGVPLAQTRLARALARQGHDVDLVFGAVAPGATLVDYEGLTSVAWNKTNARGMLLKIIQYLVLKKPVIVFSAEDHLNIIVLIAAVLTRSKAKISGSSRISPFDRFAYSNRPLAKGWFMKHLMRLVMWRADSLTCVSKDMVYSYHEIFKSPPHVYAYNIISDRDAFAKMNEPVNHDWFSNKVHPVVVAAGTLTRRKGFSDLIEAMRLVVRERAARLIILGEGHLRPELEMQIEELGLQDSVHLPGSVMNPLAYFARADVFALSSYSEGLPNVLVEAMMCGCTPVATDCPTGPRELLDNGKFGYLVPMRSPERLADGIKKALDKPIEKELLSEAVRPFGEDAVLARHFEMLGIPKNGLRREG